MTTPPKEGEARKVLWKCPKRVLGSQPLKHIPVEVYDEIFFWLRPAVHPNMDDHRHHKILARLATICRYFTYYCAREMARILDFDGDGRSPHPKTLTGRWCMGIIKQQEPMFTLRFDVRECVIHDWAKTSTSDVYQQGLILVRRAFLNKFPSVVSNLVNLTSLTLKKMPISLELLCAAGTLQKLQKLSILRCDMYIHADTPPSTAQQLFPALLDIYIAGTSPPTEAFIPIFRRGIIGAPTLKSLALDDGVWITTMATHVSPSLTSFTANISSIDLQTLTKFLKTHTYIRELNIYGQYSTPQDYGEGLWLDPWDLRKLEAFSGPEELAVDFLSTRGVSKLAIPSHISEPDTWLSQSVVFYETVFPPKYMASQIRTNSPISAESTLWHKINNSGESVKELALSLETTVATTLIAAHFPNLVRLELAFVRRGGSMSDSAVSPEGSEPANTDEELPRFLVALAKALEGLHNLEHLAFRPGSSENIAVAPLMSNSPNRRVCPLYAVAPGEIQWFRVKVA
ncbi:hypothetical protein BU17DRAFT_93333 [Hysterangium stoloniferum]|nr:hypothetical protein BU17DRAFT_93333 [Hysterangium stoloniferum]